MTPVAKFTFPRCEVLWWELQQLLVSTVHLVGPSEKVRDGERRRERQNRSVMGIHVPDTHSIYWSQLTLAPLTWWASRADHYPTSIFFPLSHCISWKLDTFYGLIDLNLINPNGKTLHCFLLETDSKGTFSEHCWSGNSRGKKHRAHPNPFIKDNHSGEMQQSISGAT